MDRCGQLIRGQLYSERRENCHVSVIILSSSCDWKIFYPFEIQCTLRTRMVLVMVQKQIVSFANDSWVKICKKKTRRTGDVRKKTPGKHRKTTMGSENPFQYSPTFTGALLPRSLKWSMSNFKCLISAWNPRFNSSNCGSFSNQVL